MLLASVKGIREQLGFDDMTDINAAIEMGLHAAEPQLASRLNTSFRRASRNDTFWVKEPGFLEGGHVSTEFRLSRGLLAAPPAVSSTVRDRLVPAVSGPDLGGAMVYDLERGIARDWQNYYASLYVTFDYQYGFEAEADNPQAYKLDQVPDWLQEAAKLLALVNVSDSPSLSSAGIELDQSVLRQQYDALISQHLRYAPMALLPL
ncbi:hypothetical protein V3589_11055 [Sinorhizobium fredii]|uniref:hypothetical protein n=1 Tax=Rhizobium fredii TaxID=380 RepID=UPI0030B62977